MYMYIQSYLILLGTLETNKRSISKKTVRIYTMMFMSIYTVEGSKGCTLLTYMYAARRKAGVSIPRQCNIVSLLYIYSRG